MENLRGPIDFSQFAAWNISYYVQLTIQLLLNILLFVNERHILYNICICMYLFLVQGCNKLSKVNDAKLAQSIQGYFMSKKDQSGESGLTHKTNIFCESDLSESNPDESGDFSQIQTTQMSQLQTNKV